MELYITGLPNSGTTYVAHLLKESGLDFGDDVWPHALHRKGMEWLPLRTWYLRMFDHVLGGPDPNEKAFTFQGRDEYLLDRPPPSDPPPCVKVPDFNIHRLYDWYKPARIIRVVRPKAGWVESMMVNRPIRNRAMLEEIYDRLVDTFPGHTVEWPRLVHDKEYLSVLGEYAPLELLTEAHVKITRPEWVSA